MKTIKTIVLMAIMLCTLKASAQLDFDVNFQLGYSNGEGDFFERDFSNSGFTYTADILWNPSFGNQKFKLGLTFDRNQYKVDDEVWTIGANKKTITFDKKNAVNFFGLKFLYEFGNWDLRPYVAFSAGQSFIKAYQPLERNLTLGDSKEERSKVNGFGIKPEIGIAYKSLTFGVSYLESDLSTKDELHSLNSLEFKIGLIFKFDHEKK